MGILHHRRRFDESNRKGLSVLTFTSCEPMDFQQQQIQQQQGKTKKKQLISVAGPALLRDGHAKPTGTGKRVVHQLSPLFHSMKTTDSQEPISDGSTIGTCTTWQSRGAMSCTSTTTLERSEEDQLGHHDNTSKFLSNTKTRKVWNQIKSSCTFQQIKPEYTGECRNIPEDLNDVRIHCDELLSLNQELVYDDVVNANTASGENLNDVITTKSGFYNRKKWNARIKECSNRTLETKGDKCCDSCSSQKDDIIPQPQVVDYIGQYDSMSSIVNPPSLSSSTIDTLQETEKFHEELLSGTSPPSKKERQRRWASTGWSTTSHSTRMVVDPLSTSRRRIAVPQNCSQDPKVLPMTKRDEKNHEQKLSALRDDVLLIYGIDITKER